MSASAPLALTLPDNCWQQRWADIIRNSKTLESIGFIWDKTAACKSQRRAELFVDWLGTRVGKKTSELELALTPDNPSLITQAFKNNLWCILGQMAATLKHLAIKASGNLVTDVGPWITSFSQLEYLLLAPRGNSLSVRTSLGSLTRLKDLVLSVKQHDLVDNMEDQAALAGAGHNLSLNFPSQHPAWLPASLTALRLECPTLSTLPGCLSGLSGLASLELSTRSMLTNSSLILAHTGVKSLELSGCVPSSFVGQLSAFTRLSALSLSHLPLGAGNGAAVQQQLQQGLTELKQLKQLSLSYCHLGMFPEVVRSLSQLAFLDLSFNPQVTSFPPGDHLRSLELLAADWAAIAPEPSGLQSASALEELCLTDRPPDSDSVARVLRALCAMPQLSAVYFDTGPGTQMTHDVVLALTELARERPTLQFKSLEDCMW
ncbi:hypothetical protein N2152v2_008337 [Parachlorella kessleri]